MEFVCYTVFYCSIVLLHVQNSANLKRFDKLTHVNCYETLTDVFTFLMMS